MTNTDGTGATVPPWKVFSLNGVLAIMSKTDREIIHWSGFDASSFDDATNRANAALIVRAVNRDSQFEAMVGALRSASAQCGNVIYNCEQRPADNQRHLDSWRGVKEFVDAALLNAKAPT